MSSDSSFSSETDIGDMEDRKVQPSTFNSIYRILQNQTYNSYLFSSRNRSACL